MPRTHRHETHRSQRAPWLRAGVLGANDGIVSTAALMIGVAASSLDQSAVIAAGLAGLVAGAGSMAVGEYVSVSSQRDAERADLDKEQNELAEFPEAELNELTEIYVRRGLDRSLAEEVARQMHDHDALGAHLRDELGLDRDDLARPGQAASTSALAFAIGAAVPVLVGLSGMPWLIALTALVCLAALGALAAGLGGANRAVASFRVVATSGLAMAVTYLIGRVVGTAV